MSDKLQPLNGADAEELDALKGRIAEYDREFHRAFQRQMGFAFLAGCALNRAKEILPHGRFMEWRESELSVQRSSAERYMKFADALGKFPTVGNLKEVKLLGEGEPLSPAQQKKICEAVHELADGKTLTEMYRDLGVIRQPQKPKHHPRKPLTPEEELAERREADQALRDAWLAPLTLWRDCLENADDAECPHYTRAEWQAMLDALVSAGALCREHLKTKGAGR